MAVSKHGYVDLFIVDQSSHLNQEFMNFEQFKVRTIFELPSIDHTHNILGLGFCIQRYKSTFW